MNKSLHKNPTKILKNDKINKGKFIRQVLSCAFKSIFLCPLGSVKKTKNNNRMEQKAVQNAAKTPNKKEKCPERVYFAKLISKITSLL